MLPAKLFVCYGRWVINNAGGGNIQYQYIIFVERKFLWNFETFIKHLYIRWPIRAIHKTFVQCKNNYLDTLFNMKFGSMQNKFCSQCKTNFVPNAKQILFSKRNKFVPMIWSQCKTNLFPMQNKIDRKPKSCSITGANFVRAIICVVDYILMKAT